MICVLRMKIKNEGAILLMRESKYYVIPALWILWGRHPSRQGILLSDDLTNSEDTFIQFINYWAELIFTQQIWEIPRFKTALRESPFRIVWPEWRELLANRYKYTARDGILMLSDNGHSILCNTLQWNTTYCGTKLGLSHPRPKVSLPSILVHRWTCCATAVLGWWKYDYNQGLTPVISLRRSRH